MTQRKCRYPDCGRPARTRGLCKPCHAQAVRFVRLGKTTWEKLERSGKVSKLVNRTKGFAEWLTA